VNHETAVSHKPTPLKMTKRIETGCYFSPYASFAISGPMTLRISSGKSFSKRSATKTNQENGNSNAK
jgi:hypothetical protein